MKGRKKNTNATVPDVEEWQSAKAFLSFKPPEYYGSTDPSKTWTWLVDLEHIFDICGCDDRHKVQHAVRMLRGWALDWWATFRKSNGNTTIDWKDFVNRMKKDFCLEEHLVKLEREFPLLEKEEYMSVEEYAQVFVKKMRLVKHMVSHENDKIYHFTEGLPRAWREYVGKATTLTQAIFRAMDTEEEYWGCVTVEEESCASPPHEQTSEEEEKEGKERQD